MEVCQVGGHYQRISTVLYYMNNNEITTILVYIYIQSIPLNLVPGSLSQLSYKNLMWRVLVPGDLSD